MAYSITIVLILIFLFLESFNVTTISSSVGDKLLESSKDSDKASSSPATSMSSSVSQPVLPSQFSSASTAEQTFPLVAGQPIDIKIPCIVQV